MQDPFVVPVPAGDLTKVGPGTVVFPSANTYSGNTLVSDGVLNVRHAGALGRHRETQTITVGGSTSGTFQLTFNGSTTGSLGFLIPASGGVGPLASVENALNALGSIGGASVNVVRRGNVFTVSFNGPLSPIGSQRLMTAAGAGGTTAVIGSAWEVQTVTVLGANGTFALRFDGQQTAALPLTATALDVEMALEVLSTIGAGNVQVTKTANVFTIFFTGSLAGANQNQITAVVTGGGTALVGTVTDGPEGTLVSNGASLQIQGSVTVPEERLTINGSGTSGEGALNNAADDNTWAGTITLGSSSAIGVAAAGDTLTVTGVITDGPGVLDVTKVGPGTLTYQGTADNTYKGLPRSTREDCCSTWRPASCRSRGT
ncbi:MAG: autotransporter-associated beta strand repeat-containing protein [Gemmataceae bacterium]|nr:autotransporter-associated beta strand repeat-containing protein [Gemmataceae bacterium]